MSQSCKLSVVQSLFCDVLTVQAHLPKWENGSLSITSYPTLKGFGCFWGFHAVLYDPVRFVLSLVRFVNNVISKTDMAL